MFKPVQSSSPKCLNNSENFLFLAYVSSITNRASAASKNYLHATNIQRPTSIQSSTVVFIEEWGGGVTEKIYISINTS